jgi:hypothetical protein
MSGRNFLATLVGTYSLLNIDIHNFKLAVTLTVTIARNIEFDVAIELNIFF